MTLDQLRVFVAVAERQHVTRAADSLNLAQSAASAAIAALEARHGTKLFHRVGRHIELSEAGRMFLPEARAVLARAEAAEQTLAELGGLKRGLLRVQASQTISSYWLPRHLVAFRKAYPAITLHITIGNTAQVTASVLAGDAELGFVEGVVADPLLRLDQVARDRLLILVGREHAWATSAEVAPSALLETDWVLRERGSGTRSAFAQALSGFGISIDDFRIALELPSNEAVRAAVESGLGATCLSASVAAPALEAGLLHRVPFDLPDRAFTLLRHTERHLSHAAMALIDIVHAKT
jgi:DNA-binding transcriptional LysR family regulator